MRFQITHVTRYEFSEPVVLEPHTLRFQPRGDASQCVQSSELEIVPSPSGFATGFDIEGNSFTQAWFAEPASSLQVTAGMVVETLRPNPFDFLLTPQNARLPIGYDLQERTQLKQSLYRKAGGRSDVVGQLAARMAASAEGRVVDFLVRLCNVLYTTCEVVYRAEGFPQDPFITLLERRGACRDLAVLFIDACRAVGIAARFVSGYQEGDPDLEHRDLHGWAEVYLPGAGWRGFDPTHGMAVSDRHVAIAASVDPRNTSPIQGTFRGTGVTSRMTTSVLMATEAPQLVLR